MPNHPDHHEGAMRDLNSTNLNGRGYLPAILYFGFLLFVGVFAARQGLSQYFADKAFVTGSDLEVASSIYYQSENPDAYKICGMIALRNKDYAAAAEAFEKAVSLRKHDFMLWLRLGYSRYQLNDLEAAKTAYKRALLLAPNYGQPNFLMGKMLLETGHPENAFEFLAKVAKSDAGRYPEILHLARITFPDDPVAIENAVKPESAVAKKIVARYLIRRFWMTDSVRSFLVSDQLNESEKNDFISYLIYKRNFTVAREVWLSRLKTENVSGSEMMFDGGFEHITESDTSGFGWQIDQKIPATAVARDDKNVHSGSSAIQIRFAGNVETDRKILSQLAYIQPRTKYQLKFFFRSTELISAGLPLIIISDGVSNEILGRSELTQTTDGNWIEAKVDFNTKNAPVAFVSLQRSNCNTSPCPIFGELTLDDFSLHQY